MQQLLTRCVVGQGQDRQVPQIDVLPDDVLLEMFDFCLGQDRSRRIVYTGIKKEIEAWQTLVCVCRRWRSVVFGSPLRLNLELVCTDKTPARDTLNVWPPLPIVIRSPGYYRVDSNYTIESVDNFIAVLERSDRVCRITLMEIPNSHFQELLAAVQVPFPELTHLLLHSYEKPVIPDSFLGGSAPRLQDISLYGLPFPGLPRLLLSATHLLSLQIENIPHSGYFSPEAMATALSTLTSLTDLSLEFQSPQSRPDQGSRRPPPLTRSVLPVLTNFIFKGVSDYLEYLVASIEAPQLNNLCIIFFNQIIFDTPQVIQFLNRAPTLRALEKGHVTFGNDAATVELSSTTNYGELSVKVPCWELDWQVSSLEQVCTSSLPPLSALEDLYIHKAPKSRTYWQGNIENALWLELLHPFIAAKNVYLDVEFASRIVPALGELVGGRATEALPHLQNIFLEKLESLGPVQEGILQFVAARQVTSHPIAISRWDDPERDKSWKRVWFYSRFY